MNSIQLEKSKGRSRAKSRTRQFHCEALEPRHLLAANPIITEFMASNNNTVSDGFGSETDWIEIHNAGDMAVDLQGYHVTDSASELTKWTFPTSTVLEPDEYLLVFASGLNTIDPAGYHHTQFKLKAGGEYLALVSPSQTVLSEFGPNGTDYLPQFTDISYGVEGGVLLTGKTDVDFLIPADDNVDAAWTSVGFNASANGFTKEEAAVGYESNPGANNNYNELIETPISAGTTSVYLRHEFELTNAAAITDLNLNLHLDDGAVVYLNGQSILSVRAPANPSWNSVATGQLNDALVIQGEDFDLSNSANLLQNGTNVLAIHAMNRNASSSDFLISPTLSVSGNGLGSGYLSDPTPGAENSGLFPQGPIIADVDAVPKVPVAGQPLIIEAEIFPFGTNINNSTVTMTYRRMFGSEVTVLMQDNGLGDDTTAGDNIYTATIPANQIVAGQMIRWFVTAGDFSGRTSRAPQFLAPLDSAEYFGAVAPDPNASTDLPVIYWFVENEAAAETRNGTRASLYYRGEFYDNIQVDLHGQSSANFNNFKKRSYDFDANSGDKFDIADGVGRHSDFNLLTNYADQTKLRHPLAYNSFEATGVSASLAYTVSVHRNGQFFGLYDFVEEGDSEQLRRQGLDDNGNLYKVNNRLVVDARRGIVDPAIDRVEKKSGVDASHDDFREVIAGAALSGTAATNWDFDNLDMADFVNYLATAHVIQQTDFGHKNMYWYHDIAGTGLWTALPWDTDLSFGHRWNNALNSQPAPAHAYFDNNLSDSSQVNAGSQNPIFGRLLSNPTFKAMHDRRMRTIMDQLLGPAGTPVANSFLGQEIAARAALVADEAVADTAAIESRVPGYGIHPSYQTAYPFNSVQAADRLLNEWLPTRKNVLEGINAIPNAHGDSSDIRIGTIDYDPTSGDLNEQYIVIENTENFAVDISGWTLDGAMQHTFKPGTVILPNSELHLTANAQGFLGRTTGPAGGQQRFIQEGHSGNISPVGGVLELSNVAGAIIDSGTYGLTADLNSNGVVNCNDLNLLSTVAAANQFQSTFDLTGDGTIDRADIDVWLAQAAVVNLPPGGEFSYGDGNLDGVVDEADFGIWNANRFTVSSQMCGGDFNVDGVVDVSDFNVWLTNQTPTQVLPGSASIRIPRAAPPAVVVDMTDSSASVPTDDLVNAPSLTSQPAEQNEASDDSLPSDVTAPQSASSAVASAPVAFTPFAANVSGIDRYFASAVEASDDDADESTIESLEEQMSEVFGSL